MFECQDTTKQIDSLGVLQKQRPLKDTNVQTKAREILLVTSRLTKNVPIHILSSAPKDSAWTRQC